MYFNSRRHVQELLHLYVVTITESHHNSFYKPFSPKDDLYNKCSPYLYQWYDLSIKKNPITWSSETNDYVTTKKVTKKELINVKKTTQRIFSILLLWWPYIHYIYRNCWKWGDSQQTAKYSVCIHFFHTFPNIRENYSW